MIDRRPAALKFIFVKKRKRNGNNNFFKATKIVPPKEISSELLEMAVKHLHPGVNFMCWHFHEGTKIKKQRNFHFPKQPPLRKFVNTQKNSRSIRSSRRKKKTRNWIIHRCEFQSSINSNEFRAAALKITNEKIVKLQLISFKHWPQMENFQSHFNPVHV